MFLSTVVPAVVLLGIVIFFHELGHFIAAKWRGVTVLKFSLGMGPELVGFTAGGTRYCLSWIPLGGFVQMAGDTPGEDGSMPVGGQEQFLTHHWLGRIVIAIAGPAANLVTAYVVMVIMCLHGITSPDFPARLGPLADTTAAYRAGLRAGDQVVQLGGRTVKTWHEMDEAIASRDTHQPFGVVLDRAGAPVVLRVPAAQVRDVFRDLAPVPSPAVVGSLMTGMPAYRGGVKEGDTIVAVDGRPVQYFTDIGAALVGKVDHVVKLTVRRGTQLLDLTVTPLSADGSRGGTRGIIGIEAVRGLTWTQRMGPGEALSAGFTGTIGLIGTVYSGMWLTISRPMYYRDYVGGPIYIGQMAGDAARKGIDQWLYLLAMINLAIMSFNLLPVPLLDGGHIALALVEALRRRSLSARTYINFQKVGLVLVGTLFVFILSKDIMRPLQRQRAVDHAPRETTTVAPVPH